VWMAQRGRKTRFLAVPTAIMFLVTLCALGWMSVQFVLQGRWLLAFLALLLGVLALVLVRDAYVFLRRGGHVVTRAAGGDPTP